MYVDKTLRREAGPSKSYAGVNPAGTVLGATSSNIEGDMQEADKEVENHQQNTTQEPHSLEELIDTIEAIEAPSGQISFDAVLDAIGRRSFGPLLLLAGLVTLAPVISGIPGVPVAMGLFTLLISAQLLLGRRTFWLPAWLRARKLARDKVHKGFSWMRKPARLIDRVLRHRCSFITGKRGVQLTALACLLLALVMPPMELVPLSANIAGTALSLFGLALMARDGLLSILGFMVTGFALVTVFYNLF